MRISINKEKNYLHIKSEIYKIAQFIFERRPKWHIACIGKHGRILRLKEREKERYSPIIRNQVYFINGEWPPPMYLLQPVCKRTQTVCWEFIFRSGSAHSPIASEAGNCAAGNNAAHSILRFTYLFGLLSFIYLIPTVSLSPALKNSPAREARRTFSD